MEAISGITLYARLCLVWLADKRAVFAFLAVAVIVGGCASKYLEPPNSAQTSLVYGFLDMGDAPANLESFVMKQVKPKSDEPYWRFRLHEGVFYMENMPLGSYQLDSFGGSTKMLSLEGALSNASRYVFQFPRQVQREGRLWIEKPGLYFLGSFRFQMEGSFFDRKFDITKSNTPSEKEILEKVLPYAAGTRWAEQIKTRMKRLSR